MDRRTTIALAHARRLAAALVACGDDDDASPDSAPAA